MKKTYKILILIIFITSHLMCFLVGREYGYMTYCSINGACSSPAYVSFYLAIPFLCLIGLCGILAYRVKQCLKEENKEGQ